MERRQIINGIALGFCAAGTTVTVAGFTLPVAPFHLAFWLTGGALVVGGLSALAILFATARKPAAKQQPIGVEISGNARGNVFENLIVEGEGQAVSIGDSASDNRFGSVIKRDR